MHCVFSTKERRPFITPELQTRLYQYIGGIAKKNRMRLISAGGIEDHIHLLISLSKAMDISKAMQLIKKADPPNGYMTSFLNFACLSGKRVMVPFRSVSAR